MRASISTVGGNSSRCSQRSGYKEWWARHTYLLSAALDAGVAFMGIFIFFALQFNNINGIDWWGGVADDYCPLASCPTAPEVVIEGCPAVK
ncbi:hypothetical protein M5K25_015829 [Dendrobium thyrsiflorum]|uniref:Uncharacterized protein n=1 Tax=Dendrobium thyrsiflorum TaxID=117978 RepID=A0ABD0UYT7_DENTH